MNGIFIGYHNTKSFSGFEYLTRIELEDIMFGSESLSLKDFFFSKISISRQTQPQKKNRRKIGWCGIWHFAEFATMATQEIRHRFSQPNSTSVFLPDNDRLHGHLDHPTWPRSERAQKDNEIVFPPTFLHRPRREKNLGIFRNWLSSTTSFVSSGGSFDWAPNNR